MKINDKVLAGLLVSLGLFSAGVASRYVANLSTAEKDALMSSFQKTHNCPVQLAEGGSVMVAKVTWIA